MNFYFARALGKLQDRRSLLAWWIFLLLIVVIFLIPLLPGYTSPLIVSAYAILMAIVTNLFAALLWYSLLLAHQNLEKTGPLLRAFPFLKNKSQDILIVLASLPSRTGHELTGIGEARALGLLLEAFSATSFPPQRIIIRFSNQYTDAQAEEVLRNRQAIILGGPNFNKFAAILMRLYSNELDYMFMEDFDSPADLKKCSGTIVSNRAERRALTSPLPEKVRHDVEVVRDCGLIVRVQNQNGYLVTLLAGGMTTGVWVATEIMTSNSFIEQWHRVVKPNEQDTDYEIAFECPVQNLSVEPEQIRLLKIRRLSQDGAGER